MAKSRKATFDEVAQCNQYFIDNYAHKIARKWGAKQGIKIKKYDDLCDEGKKEIDDLFARFPTDDKSIQEQVDNGSYKVSEG